MEASLSVLSHADGSCELWQKGRGRILCGVTGPGDVSSSRRIFDRANVFFSFNRLATKNREELVAAVKVPSAGSASASSASAQPVDHFLRSVVESAIDVDAYPRSCIQICTQELEMDGPGDALQLNGLCMALIDAGIRMRHIFAAVIVGLPSGDGQQEMVVDPNQMEANACRALFTFVFKPSVILAGKLLGAHSNASELAERRCLTVFDFYRRKIQQKFIYYISRTLS
uniref:RNase_PH domain-containing protein n=1 Tax=Globodera pallida TaxID=36090 RepID=A0A183C966_GLOPA